MKMKIIQGNGYAMGVKEKKFGKEIVGFLGFVMIALVMVGCYLLKV